MYAKALLGSFERSLVLSRGTARMIARSAHSESPDPNRVRLPNHGLAETKTMSGHGDVRAFLDALLARLPRPALRVGGGAVRRARPTQGGVLRDGTRHPHRLLAPPGFAPTGKHIDFDGADFHEYRHGRVLRLRIVFDMVDVGR